VVGFEASG
jgi:hypothetical protein